MAKVSRVANTAMSSKLHNGYNSDMDVHIFNTLSSLSDDWILYYDRNEHYCDRSRIVRKVDNGLTVGFRLLTDGTSDDKLNVCISPTIALINTYSDSPTNPSELATFDPETHTEILGSTELRGEWVFPSLMGPYQYGSGNLASLKYTACESKNKKSWTVSVVQDNKTFEVYSAYAGIDSSGTPYTVLGGNANANSTSPSAMAFGMEDDAFNYRVIYGSYPSTRNSDFRTTQSQIGFGVNSSNLTLIPLINPFTGATCTDLYIAQSGPKDTMLYDITVNGRHFVTGASTNTEPNEGMTIKSYQPQFKIFMEV